MYDSHLKHPDFKEKAGEMDRRYPEVYHRVMPYIQNLSHTEKNLERMDEHRLNTLADAVMLDSGLAHHLPFGHTRDSVKDLVKILILALVMSNGQETQGPWLPWALGLGLLGNSYPYYPYPVVPGGRPGWHPHGGGHHSHHTGGGHRGHGGGGHGGGHKGGGHGGRGGGRGRR